MHVCMYAESYTVDKGGMENPFSGGDDKVNDTLLSISIRCRLDWPRQDTHGPAKISEALPWSVLELRDRQRSRQ